MQTLRGEWHFGWALAGRAIVDVFHAAGRDHGVVVRFFDPEARIWRVSPVILSQVRSQPDRPPRRDRNQTTGRRLRAHG
jgi:hypothetical protein